MVLNAGKSHYRCLERNTESAVHYNDKNHASSRQKTILGITIKRLCKKASQKLSPSSRIAPQIDCALLRFFDTRYYNSTILGITIYNKPYSHIKRLCKKASQKLSSLSRIAPYLDSSQKNLSVNVLLKNIEQFY